MTKREQIGERIRQRLQFLDKNQTWLADQFGVQQSTMSQYINGVRGLEAAELARLAQILDIEVAYFYGEADLHGRDVPPELEMVYDSQGKVYNDLPPGKAREKYIERLRADAETMRELLAVRLDEPG